MSNVNSHPGYESGFQIVLFRQIEQIKKKDDSDLSEDERALLVLFDSLEGEIGARKQLRTSMDRLDGIISKEVNDIKDLLNRLGVGNSEISDANSAWDKE